MMSVKTDICQSCAYPMTREEDYGTEADGSRNRKYCSMCYKDGQFIDPNLTLEEMIELSAKGWSEADPDVTYEKAFEECRKSIPYLERWRK